MLKTKNLSLLFLVTLLCFSWLTLLSPEQALAARAIFFPVVGNYSFSNDFYAPRGSQTHNAIDILAPKGAPLVSVVNGTIVDVQYPQPTWGYSVTVRDSEGYEYTYVHMNDDRPGTNDGKGGAMNAYAPYVKEGQRVYIGQLIGKVGDSGHSNGVSHLHFEMYLPNGNVANPYNSLTQARHISKPVAPPAIANELLPFGFVFDGGLNVAMGNVDEDPASESVIGAGVRGGPHVKVYETDRTTINSFFAYDPAFRGGVDVAMGDVDGNGTDEIITGPGAGGGPQVKVFKFDGTSATNSFFAFTSSGRTGIRVAAGDVDGDGDDEVIASLQAGSEPLVRVFDLNESNQFVQVQSFYAYTAAFTGGVDVASGDVTGDNKDEIVTGPGSSGGPQVRIFSANGTVLGNFLAYDSTTQRGGVRVSVGNVQTGSAKDEIVTMPAVSGSPISRMFSGAGTQLASKNLHEVWWIGYFDVAAGFDTSLVATGTNRRASLVTGIE